MMGQGGLADLQLLQKFTGTFFTAAQHFQDLQTVFITKGLKYAGRFFICRRHMFTSLS